MGSSKFVLLAFLISAILGIQIPGWAAPLAVSSGKVHFLAVGRPAMIKINGESDQLMGSAESQDNKARGHFDFDLSTLKTGVDLRDRHMKEKYLETDKFKTAILSFLDVAMPTDDKETEQVLKAKLIFHDVEKPVDVKLKLKKMASGFEGQGSFSILLTDFNVQIPSYIGIKVADQVQVTVDFKAH